MLPPVLRRRSKVPLIIADALSEGLPLFDGASGAPGLSCPSIAKASTEFTQSRQDHQKDCGHKRKDPLAAWGRVKCHDWSDMGARQ